MRDDGRSPATALPIEAVLEDLTDALAAGPNAVLVAPPGAGKTTRVPLALLDRPWVADRRIVVLEPRRLAARAAADRMAFLLGERVGETVGLRVRMETRVSGRTRIEVVTEGVFARQIISDPSLEGVAAILFDEFHERSLDADFGLALALECQGALRPDLRILVMSATLDDARIAAHLGNAPVIRSEGRAFPVETRHLGRDPGRRIEDEVTDAVVRALRTETGSCLVFLPGAGEIRRVAGLLADRIDPSVLIAPLHGSLDRAEQDRAVKPSPDGRRKVVLATSIAETSLTIEGVRVVVDSGLARVPVYEPGIGLTRLVTARVSRAAADQRRGRAGRTEPGLCFRLWEEAATGSLEPFGRPEILSADLAPLTLDSAAWGATDLTALPFLDPPPRAALAEARALLGELGGIDPATGRITPSGEALRSLPLPPRLARMVLTAARTGAEGEAALLAVLLAERGLGGDAVDLAERLDRLRRDPSRRAADARRLAGTWAATAERLEAASSGAPASSDIGTLLALAFPDRIARARGAPGEFVMANGRGAKLEPHLGLARAPFLAIGEIAGSAAGARILAAAAIDRDGIERAAGDRVVAREETVFDPQARALRARSEERLGALVLSSRPRAIEPSPEAAEALARGAAALGLDDLSWSAAARRTRARVAFLRGTGAEDWPDLSDEALAATVADWLAPHLTGKTRLDEIEPAELDSGLAGLLPWPLPQRLDAEAPDAFTVPTGSRITIDYAQDGGPVLAVRVQELFGLALHPAIAGGRVPLVLHLLSPAGRPIQVTRDLPGFWQGSWAEVRSAMRGRYPRHPWPEDPTVAEPTRRAKPRGT